MCGGMFDSPDIPPPPPPIIPPAPEKAPDQDVFKDRNRNQAKQFSAMAGNQSTMLSGAGGVATDTLNLGKNTVLGA